MRGSSPNLGLRSGDIFEVHGPAALDAGSDVPAYFVRETSAQIMKVAEIGGQNRDVISLNQCEMPSPLSIYKWKMRCEIGGTMNGFVDSKVQQLRRHLTSLRFADRIGAHTHLCAPYFSGPVDAISIINHADSPAFYQSQYLYLENGNLLPSMRLFDLGLMGVISEDRIARNENGSAASYAVGINDCVTPEQVSAVDQFAARHDLNMYPNSYSHARLFSTNNCDGLDRIEAYFPDAQKNNREFPRLKDAHNAVLDFRSRLGK